ncbi:hypothetical protein BH10PSE4_BH10PSE4_08370 [soil metagenome]
MRSLRSFTNKNVDDYLVQNGLAEAFLKPIASADRSAVAKLLNKALRDKTGQTGIELAERYIEDATFTADLARRVAED